MKLKRENGYWTLASSGLGDLIRGSSLLKKYGKAYLVIYVVFMFFGGPIVYLVVFHNPSVSNVEIFFLFIFMPFILPVLTIALAGRILYGSLGGWEEKDVELPNVEFHALGTCQGYGNRILNMVEDLNVADYYIFLLNFHNLFYHEEHKLENPDQRGLNAIGRAVRVLPERRRGNTSIGNPFRALTAGAEALRDAGEKRTVEYYTKKLGALPEPSKAASIIKKEYLPDLLHKFERDVALYTAVIMCSTNNYTAMFPYDDRVVSEEEAVEVATNPTRENVVNYCSKFKGIAAEEPAPKRKGLMEN